MIHRIVFALFVLLTFNIYNEQQAHASQLSLRQIDEDKQLLREIVTKIVNQQNVYDAIKLKLRTYHSTDAKAVWSNYNKTTLPKANDHNYNTNITIGNLRFEARKDILSLVGKTTNTFYAPQEIDTIQNHVQTAIQHGTIQVNPRNPDTILIDHNLNLNFGEVCTKNATPPFNVNCNHGTTITIVLIAKQFLDDIKQNGKNAWKEKNLAGSIQNIYAQ
ncbi:hypothetical protein IM40_05860 [Candidatus Paracaedimonas acanthamoebae]|nr:hypothetical protein IM40_05860 [Candidatus Paracaedimonas acanthamoebae]